MTRTTRLGLIGMVVAVALIANSAMVGAERAPVAAFVLLLTSFVLYMFDD